MDPKETVQNLFNAIQAANFEKAKSLLTDDFMFSGPVPEPITGSAWLGLSAGLKTAFSDLDYQFKIESIDGDTVDFIRNKIWFRFSVVLSAVEHEGYVSRKQLP
jgi:hypothetical protein